jgi:hypothetical protein
METDAGRRPTALVTGASSGIGLELCRLLAAGGHDLVLVGRRRERLAELAGELRQRFGARTTVIARDLADPESPAAIFRDLEALSIELDVLVNNAGFGLHGRFAGTGLEEELRMLQVNVVALTHLTKLALRGMVARGRGRILNVASTAAFQPGPLMAVYYASKAYVLSFSEAVANELQGTGVTLTCLCPGPTRTGFQKEAGMEQARLFRGGMVMDAAAVAQAGYRALLSGKRTVVPGLRNRLLAQVVKFVPRRLVLRATRKLNHPRAGSVAS